MSRYIDADALYEYITNRFGGVDCAVLLDENIAPSIDIVFCKECKHWDEWRSKGGACYKALSVGFIIYRNPDDFCSYGEREGE